MATKDFLIELLKQAPALVTGIGAARSGPAAMSGFNQGRVQAQQENYQRRQEEAAQAEEQRRYQTTQQERLRQEQRQAQQDKQAALMQALRVLQGERAWQAETAEDPTVAENTMMQTAQTMAEASGGAFDAGQLPIPSMTPVIQTRVSERNRKVLADLLEQFDKRYGTTPGADELEVETPLGRIPVVELRRLVGAQGSKDGTPVPPALKAPGSLQAAIVEANARGDTAEVERLVRLQQRINPPAIPPVTYLPGQDGTYAVTRGDPARAQPVRSAETGELLQAPASATQRPTTGTQRLVAGYARRMQQAEDVLNTIEDQVVGMNPLFFAFQRGVDQPMLQSSEMQQYMQAARNFISAILRRESGAAISEKEWSDAQQQYLPVPGNDETVLAQKRANRQLVIENFQREAGAALDGPPNDAAEPDLTGLPRGSARRFNSGPFAGQVWRRGENGQPERVQ